MGHRANFVVIRNGQASAFYDDWAALGCIHSVADGPEDAAATAADFEPTGELLDWAFMEGGYLVDFDQKTLIVFGLTEDDFEDEFGEFEEDDAEGVGEAADPVASAELGGDGFDPEDEDDDEGDWDVEAERAAALAFLQGIAPKWSGWTLRWDQRGADAFAEHLQRRGIEGIATQPASAGDALAVELRA